MNLYHLSNEFLDSIENVQKLIDDGFSIDSAEVQDALTAMIGNEDSFKLKGINVAKYIQSLRAESAAIKLERERLQKKEKSADSRADSLENILLSVMTASGCTLIDDAVMPVRIKENTWSVDVTDIDALPDKYKRVTTTVEPDKRSLLAIREGCTIAGVSFKRNLSLRIG